MPEFLLKVSTVLQDLEGLSYFFPHSTPPDSISLVLKTGEVMVDLSFITFAEA
ncbi:hypothetical protein ML462_08435 [Gramella lutea]|uniref:Uncharacterized protein n=1 Tax=Christiangramia lutea TaxID=1607951 RepID=A0A9X1V349_9FLAO|nr:hypothetical protein [Christiangramia lutea]MCH4823201.1 hypothetical protein [Christiangramia lutea]